MKEILIFAGTIEGRKLSEYLTEAGISHTVCVATEYGEIVLRQHLLVKVHQGRMNQEQIERFLSNGKFDVVVDATHPFAKEITCNIQAALKEMGQIGISIPYLRLKRDGIVERENGISYFETNEAIIHQYEIASLVTKKSGVPGGFKEKINATKKTGTKLFVIGCPEEGKGHSFSEICQKLENMGGEKFQTKNQLKGNMEIILAGIGMGHADCLTKEVERAISEADILLGAERMLKAVCSKAEKHPFYQAEQSIPYLHDIQSESL